MTLTTAQPVPIRESPIRKNPVRENHEADTVRELTALLYAGRSALHDDLRELFARDVFEPRRGLTAAQSTAISYERLAYVRGELEPAREIVADLHRLAAVHEWAALVDGALFAIMNIHYSLCVGALVEHARDRPDLEPVLRELEGTSTVGSFLATELGYGSNVASLETEARYDPQRQQFVLHTPTALAQKFMSNTGQPGVPRIGIVLARMFVGDRHEGVFPFLVRIADHQGSCTGVQVTLLPEKPGLALDNAVTSFDHLVLDHSALLAGTGTRLTRDGQFTSAVRNVRSRFLSSMAAVQTGKICLAAASLAMARAALVIAVRFGEQRLTSAPAHADVPLLAHRTHQKALVDAAADVYAMTFLFNETKDAYSRWLRNRTGSGKDAIRQVAVTKALASRVAERVLTECRQRCGAHGLFSANRIADYLVLNQAVVTAEGDNQVIILKAAAELLAAPPPPPQPPPAELNLADPQMWRFLFAERTRRRHDAIHAARAGRGRAALFDRWNDEAVDACDLAHSYGYGLALEAFLAAVDQTPDSRASALLERLAGVFALRELQRDGAWFASQRLLAPDEMRLMPDVLNEAYADLAEALPALTQAFAIPDRILRSPLCSADSDYASAYDFLKPTATS